MDNYVKVRMLYLLYSMLAMEAAGDRRDIYRIVFEPHDGLHHSGTYEVYANPEFSDIPDETEDPDETIETTNETVDEPELKGEHDNGIS